MKFLQTAARLGLLTLALAVSAFSSEARLKYTSASPADMSEVDELSTIAITYSCAITSYNTDEIYFTDQNNKNVPFQVTTSLDKKTLYIAPFKDGEQYTITTAGEYSLIISSGTILFDEYPDGNTYIDFLYYVTGGQHTPTEMTVTPPAGDVSALSIWTIEFDSEDWSVADESSAFTVTAPAGVTVPTLVTSKGYDTYTVSFANSQSLSAKGEYTFTIPAGKFKLGSWDEAPLNEEIVLNYTVVDIADLITVTPGAGVVTEVGAWSLTFSADWGLGTKRGAAFTLTGPEGVTIPTIKGKSMGTRYDVWLEDDVMLTTPGTYVFTIPAQKFDIGGTENPELKFEYVIKGEEGTYEGAIALNPEVGEVTEFNGATLTFTDATSVAVADASLVSLASPNGNTPVQVSASGKVVTVSVAENMKVSGNYTLSLAKGAIKVDGTNVNKDLSYTWTVPEGKWGGTYTADPASGEVKSLKDINITFVDALSLTMTDDCGPADFPKLYTSQGSVMTTASGFVNGKTLEISLSAEVTAPGEYYLKVPEKFFKVDGKYAYDVIINYTVSQGSVDPIEYSYTLVPGSGAPIDNTTVIEVALFGDDVKSVSHNSFASGDLAPHFVSEDGNYCPSIQTKSLGDGKYEFRHANPFETEGSYTLVIPANFFTITANDDRTEGNKEITATYKYTEGGVLPIEYSYSITPADDDYVDNSTVIEVAFFGEEVASVAYDASITGDDAPHFFNLEGHSNPTVEIKSVGQGKYEFSIVNPFTESGAYTFVIPDGYFTITATDGRVEGAVAITVDYNYKESGIAVVAADADGNYVVYNMVGHCVLRTSDASKVKALAPGFYVVNGKKLFVK